MWISRLSLAGLLVVATHGTLASQGQDARRAPDAHLQEALARGDVKAVEAAINEGGRPALIYGPCQTPLHVAAARGPIDILRLLLGVPGVAVDTADDVGHTPLHIAAAAGNIPAIQLLVRARADLNARYSVRSPSCLDDGTHQENGDTPLLVALKHQKWDAARALLEAGADPLMPNASNQTALFLSARANQAPLFQLLLDRGSDVHLTTVTGDGPLSAAAANGNVQMVRAILARRPVLDQQASAVPLQRAARGGHLPVVKALIDAGAPVTEPVLAQAALSGKPDVVDYTAAAMRSRGAQDGSLARVLLLVASQPDATADAVRVLRSGTSSVDVQGECGRTPLVAAARIGNAAVVEALLAAGADPNNAERTDEGSCIGTSGIIAAAAHANIRMIDALVRAGARLTRRDGLAWNALETFDAAVQSRGTVSDDAAAVRRRMEEKARTERLNVAVTAVVPGAPSQLSLLAMVRVAKAHAGQSSNGARWTRIAETASRLNARWAAVPIGAVRRDADVNGLPVLWPRNQVEYRASLAHDLDLLDVAARSEGADLIDLVADDLATKLADCAAGGQTAAGEDIFVTFKLMPDVPRTDFRLFYKSRLLFALDRARQIESEYGQSENLAPSSVKVPPGTYLMYAKSESTGARTPCVRITVGRNASRDVTFSTSSASPGNTCLAP
jgi:ankyrin repeat protein